MSLHDDIAADALKDREVSMCAGCHGHGYIPDGDDDNERWWRCDNCGGSGYLKPVVTVHIVHDLGCSQPCTCGAVDRSIAEVA